jgi:uncharacterized iron-regulated membrane protein
MNVLKKIHKWTSCIVGLQLLLWLVSGLYFNVMDGHKASGKSYYIPVPHSNKLQRTGLLEPKQIMPNFQPSVSLQLIYLLDKPYYLLKHKETLYDRLPNYYSLVDAINGLPIVIDSHFASALAKRSFTGKEQPRSVQLLQPPIADFPKEKNSLWQVSFANEINTSVYIDAGSGRLVGHSDDEKRLADFFYMLHFMDYANLGHFNSIQLMIFAFITFWLIFSGALWSYNLLQRGAYRS